jgi:zinc D-Ala-D-Ala dipeptidase
MATRCRSDTGAAARAPSPSAAERRARSGSHPHHASIQATGRTAARRVLFTLAAALLAGCAGSGPSAGAACPAALPGLVDLRSLDSPPVLEIRYSTADNFTGSPLPGYEEPRALLRPDAAAALGRVAERLRAEGLGLKVWDAYRPRRASRAMVDWARRTGNEWVIEEGYVAPESGHNRGATIDLTLIGLDSGEELRMGTAYDEFTESAHTANASGDVLENRRRLVRAMEAEGWENYPLEWWHFSRPGEEPPLDVPLACYP